MKKQTTQLAAFLTLFHLCVIAWPSLFAQEGMPNLQKTEENRYAQVAKDDMINPGKYAQTTATLSLLQTFPGLPPSGRNGSFLGKEVTNLGDVNADGYDDWAIGLKDAAIYPSGKKTGKVYIYFGGTTLVNEKDPNLILTGEADNDRFGSSVATAGDVNHDGFSDVIVGAYWNNAGGFLVGRAYLYFGGTSMDNKADVIFTGEASFDYFGYSVSAAGDVNQDGFSDVIVGAYSNKAGGTLAGRAYLYFGGASMDNSADVIFTGAASFDRFGYSVAAAGDVNQDGFSDLIVGADQNNAGGVDAGRAYLYFGGASMDNSADVIFTGAASFDLFGNSVAAAGDVNHDGFSDVIVGADWNDAGGSDAGRAYLYFGGTSMDNSADVIFTGETSFNLFGISVSSAGDVNHDGFSDVIVGASAGASGAGRAYLYFGGASMDNIADVIFTGAASFDLFGNSVSFAGDVNRDGFSDVIVGAEWNDAGGSDAGRAYVYFGGASMDNMADVILTGEASLDRLGISVSAAGDVNQDGFSDVLVGAYLNDASGSDAGCAYLYWGGANMDNIADVIFTGEASFNLFGISVSSAGDVNQDGFSDVIVGANSNSAGGTLAGRAYLYFGGTSMDNIADVIFTGEDSFNYFGISVSAAGDVNHDGFSDVLVGAEGNAVGGFDAGRAYLYFGGASMDNIADVIFTGEAGFDRFGNSVSSVGDVNQDGFSDVIVGAELNDAGGFDAGRAYLYLGGSSMNNIADVIFTGEASGNLFGNSVSSADDVNHDGFSDVLVGGIAAGRGYLYFGGTSMDNIADVIFTGEASSDLFGMSVSSAGDVNHDEFSDVIIGATRNDAGGFDAGRAYLYLGGPSMDNIADVIFTGQASSDYFGISVSSAGDVNNDGFSEVIVGADENSAVGYKMGRAYVYAGGAITVGVEDKANEIPGRYHLFQNYPNPFSASGTFGNPTTSIRFSLPQREHVTLKIFDLLGKEVATLVENDLDPGEHAVFFDGSGLSSGVYLYHFKAGAFVARKKLVLLR